MNPALGREHQSVSGTLGEHRRGVSVRLMVNVRTHWDPGSLSPHPPLFSATPPLQRIFFLTQASRLNDKHVRHEQRRELREEEDGVCIISICVLISVRHAHLGVPL